LPLGATVFLIQEELQHADAFSTHFE
jgi:hypothetical protein